MILVGDSHTRSYAGEGVFEKTIFLGEGKKVNLLGVFARAGYLLRLLSLRKNLPCINNHRLAIIIGEPDTRFHAYGSWRPKYEGYLSDSNSCEQSSKTALRLDKLLKSMKKAGFEVGLVIGAATPNSDLPYSVKRLNLRLAGVSSSHEIDFFDAQKYVSGLEEQYSARQLLNPSEPDKVHVSRKIAEDLAKEKSVTLQQEAPFGCKDCIDIEPNGLHKLNHVATNHFKIRVAAGKSQLLRLLDFSAKIERRYRFFR
jgi:hypothetical protein